MASHMLSIVHILDVTSTQNSVRYGCEIILRKLMYIASPSCKSSWQIPKTTSLLMTLSSLASSKPHPPSFSSTLHQRNLILFTKEIFYCSPKKSFQRKTPHHHFLLYLSCLMLMIPKSSCDEPKSEVPSAHSTPKNL